MCQSLFFLHVFRDDGQVGAIQPCGWLKSIQIEPSVWSPPGCRMELRGRFYEFACNLFSGLRLVGGPHSSLGG